METAAVYARISLDRTEDAAGVERQVADAEAIAKARGWTVVESFVDNDRSAFNGKPRPAWRDLLAALADGRVIHVVSWANDRLYRRTRDQLDLMEAVRLAGGTIATAKDGDVDPGSASGRMTMTILSSVAEFESSRKAERVARASEQRAASGKPHGRPSYGWRSGPDGWELDSDAAALIREAAARVLRGESCGQIAKDFDARGIPTPAAAPSWSHKTIRKLLRRPSTAGLREHRGEIAGPGTWPPILDRELWDRVVAALARPGQRRPRSYLLTGLVVCGADGERMVGHLAKARGYECVKCQRRITADGLDRYVTEQVLEALNTPRLADRLARARSDRGEAEALRDVDRADVRLADLAAMFGRGDLETAEYRVARKAAVATRDAAAARLGSRRSSAALTEAVSSTGLRELWETQPLAWRRELIAAVVEQIEVGQATRPVWEPDRVSIAWRG